MNMVEIDNDDGLDEETLVRLEFRLKRKIPKSYRDFLKLHNGGQPTPNAFNFADSNENEPGGFAREFCGIYGRKESWADLACKSETYRDRIPKDLMPIADTEGGNVLCMGTKSHNYGKIYYWNHEFEADPDQGEIVDYSNITLVADDFESFLNGLYEYVDGEEIS
jgi:SMI1 / KNR4 family (SUKH-1)